MVMTHNEIAMVLCIFMATISAVEAIFTKGARGDGWAFLSFICLLVAL